MTNLFFGYTGSVKIPRAVGCPHQALSKSPVGTEDVHEGEGHREGAEEDVGDGQVGDQDVTGRPHALEAGTSETTSRKSTRLVPEESNEQSDVGDAADDGEEAVQEDQGVVGGVRPAGRRIH